MLASKTPLVPGDVRTSVQTQAIHRQQALDWQWAWKTAKSGFWPSSHRLIQYHHGLQSKWNFWKYLYGKIPTSPFCLLAFFVQRWPYVVDRILKSLLVYLNVVFLFDWELGLEASSSVLSLFSCHLLWCVWRGVGVGGGGVAGLFTKTTKTLVSLCH